MPLDGSVIVIILYYNVVSAALNNGNGAYESKLSLFLKLGNRQSAAVAHGRFYL